jgi:hypothetical protein
MSGPVVMSGTAGSCAERIDPIRNAQDERKNAYLHMVTRQGRTGTPHALGDRMKNKLGYTFIALMSAASLAALGCDASSGAGPIEDDGSGTSGAGGSTSSNGAGATSGTGSGNGSTGSGNPSSGSGGGVTIEAANMIDDLEDGDPMILASGGRIGAWYTYNDETADAVQSPAASGSFTPSDGGPDGSSYVAHTSGSGFIEWGAGMGFDLNNKGDGMGGAGVKELYDGSKFTGIAFHAKGTTAIRFKLLVAGVTPEAEGGTCAMECNDAHGKAFALTSDWTQYVVPFSDLFQEGWGSSADFDPTTLVGLQFQVAKATDFDFEIDEIGFY